ncbi:MBL fold metallo-hydrolase [Oceanobacillus sp. 143]|nr:MBL fold metallo-hydrolase [Oceanobacillus sp. 143]
MDALFLTHEDIDHTGSVAHMLEDFEVEKIIVSDYFKLPNEDLQQFKKHNISIEQVNRDDSIVIQGQNSMLLHRIKITILITRIRLCCIQN